MNEELFSKEDFVKWYSKQDVLFEIVKQIQYRETSFMNEIMIIPKRKRALNIYTVDLLKKNFHRWNFLLHGYNIYRTTAKLKNMPMMPFSKDRMNSKEYIDFKDNFKDYVIGYDFIIDFDSHIESFSNAKKDCNLVKGILDEFSVPYCIKSSGSGLHIEIDCLKSNINLSPEETRIEFKNIISKLKAFYNLKTLDLNIYDLRRIWKVAYTIDIKTGNISIPLTEKQFKNLKLKDLHVSKWLEYNFYKRGMLYKEGKQNSFNKFYQYMKGE